jgi:hypothetical protein
MASQQHVERAIHEGYNLSIGDFFSRAMRTVNDNLGVFIAGALLALVAMGGVGFVAGQVGKALSSSIESSLLSQLTNQIITQILQVGVSAPIGIGFAIAAHRVAQGKTPEINDFFAGFQKFSSLYGAGIIVALLGVLASIPGIMYLMNAGIDLQGMQGAPPEYFEDFDWGVFALGMLIIVLGGVLVQTFLVFAPYLVWFHDYSPIQAISKSSSLALKNFGGVLGLMIVSVLILMVGFIACCVGIVYAFPLVGAYMYHAYAHITRLDETDGNQSNDDLIEHFGN